MRTPTVLHGSALHAVALCNNGCIRVLMVLCVHIVVMAVMQLHV